MIPDKVRKKPATHAEEKTGGACLQVPGESCRTTFFQKYCPSLIIFKHRDKTTFLSPKTTKTENNEQVKKSSVGNWMECLNYTYLFVYT